MIPVPLIAKTVLSLLALLLLIIVVATPSLYKAQENSERDPGGSLGVFKEDGKQVKWSSIEDSCSDIKPIHTVMKVGAIVGIIAVAIGLAVNLGGYFSKIPMLSTVGVIFEVIQIVGTITLVATSMAVFNARFDCSYSDEYGRDDFKYQMNEVATMHYGMFLTWMALVLIFVNLCVRGCTKCSSNDDDGNEGQNYNSLGAQGNTQEMGYQQAV